MRLYLDTSVVVSVLTKEIATDRTQAWLDAQDPDDLFISDWVVAEFSAALSVKLRVGTIDAGERAESLSVFRALADLSIRVLPVARSQFLLAARLADQAALGLKAGDALHLAIASDHGARLCTLDRRLASAAEAHGLEANLLT